MIFRRFQHAGISSQKSYFQDKMKIRICKLRLLKTPVRQMYLQDMHARFALMHRQEIRDLGYASCNDTPVNRCKILFLEASVNRIKIYCNRFFIETLSSIFTREQKDCQQLTAFHQINTNWFS